MPRVILTTGRIAHCEMRRDSLVESVDIESQPFAIRELFTDKKLTVTRVVVMEEVTEDGIRQTKTKMWDRH